MNHDTWAGNVLAWIATVASWFNAVGSSEFNLSSILTGVLTVSTILWTVEKTRTERARRRTEELKHAALGEFVVENKGLLGRLLGRFTKPGDL